MTTQVLHMQTDVYLQGIPLSQAIFKVADAETTAAYNKTFENAPLALPEKGGGFLDLLNTAARQAQGFQRNQHQRKEIEGTYKKRLLEFIKKGDLTAFGFKMPRNIADNPVKIPPDLFFSGEINWEKSKLKSQNLEFSGIRIFENAGIIIDLTPNNSENAQKQIINRPEKAKKPDFADKDPELHIGEKEAANFLGISHRTLQGYRLNGGGPEYLKLKKAVRYKIRDLTDWANKNRKNSTSG